jgi:hypothetical protein
MHLVKTSTRTLFTPRKLALKCENNAGKPLKNPPKNAIILTYHASHFTLVKRS